MGATDKILVHKANWLAMQTYHNNARAYQRLGYDIMVWTGRQNLTSDRCRRQVFIIFSSYWTILHLKKRWIPLKYRLQLQIPWWWIIISITVNEFFLVRLIHETIDDEVKPQPIIILTGGGIKMERKYIIECFIT